MDVYVAGALAALTVDVLVYPLDTIKTRYQSQDYLSTYGPSSKNALAWRGLYQGIGSVVLATLPAAGLFFSTYEQTKTIIRDTSPAMPAPLVHACASSLAESASCLVLAPADVIKQNAQMLRGSSTGGLVQGSSSLRAFRQLTGRDAARRLFTGYTALLARNLPFTAAQFPVFEKLRAWAWEWKRRKRRVPSGRRGGSEGRGVAETGVVAGGGAGCAGAVAAFVTTPSDVVKTRMMLMAGQRGAGHGAGGRGTGHAPGDREGELRSWSVVKMVYRERGPRGFFRGAVFRSGWTAVGSALYLGTYDAAKVWLGPRRGDGVGADEGRL